MNETQNKQKKQTHTFRINKKQPIQYVKKKRTMMMKTCSKITN